MKREARTLAEKGAPLPGIPCLPFVSSCLKSACNFSLPVLLPAKTCTNTQVTEFQGPEYSENILKLYHL